MDEPTPIPPSVIIQTSGGQPANKPDAKPAATQRRVRGVPAWMTGKPAIVAGLTMAVLIEVLIWAATGNALWWLLANMAMIAIVIVATTIRRAATAKAKKSARSASDRTSSGNGAGHGRTGLGRLLGGRSKSGHGGHKTPGAGHGRGGHGRTGLGRTGLGRTGLGRTGLGRLLGGRSKSGHGGHKTPGAGHGRGGHGRTGLGRLLGGRKAGAGNRDRGSDSSTSGHGGSNKGVAGKAGAGGKAGSGTGSTRGSTGSGGPAGADDNANSDERKPSLIDIARAEYQRGKAIGAAARNDTGDSSDDDESSSDGDDDFDDSELTHDKSESDNGDSEQQGADMGKYDGMSLQALARKVRPSGQVTTELADQGNKLNAHIQAMTIKLRDLQTAIEGTAMAPQARSIVEDATRQLSSVQTQHETTMKQLAAVGAQLDLFWNSYIAHHADAEDRVNGVGGTVAQHTKSDVRQASTEI